jgi:hypothetical protein
MGMYTQEQINALIYDGIPLGPTYRKIGPLPYTDAQLADMANDLNDYLNLTEIGRQTIRRINNGSQKIHVFLTEKVSYYDYDTTKVGEPSWPRDAAGNPTLREVPIAGYTDPYGGEEYVHISDAVNHGLGSAQNYSRANWLVHEVMHAAGGGEKEAYTEQTKWNLQMLRSMNLLPERIASNPYDTYVFSKQFITGTSNSFFAESRFRLNTAAIAADTDPVTGDPNHTYEARSLAGSYFWRHDLHDITTGSNTSQYSYGDWAVEFTGFAERSLSTDRTVKLVFPL